MELQDRLSRLHGKCLLGSYISQITCRTFLRVIHDVCKDDGKSVKYLMKNGLPEMMEDLYQRSVGAVSDGVSGAEKLLEEVLDCVNNIGDVRAEEKYVMVNNFALKLLRIILMELCSFPTKLELLKNLNNLLEGCPNLSREYLQSCKELPDLLNRLAAMLFTVGDYEFQVCTIEALFRFITESERPDAASKWFNEHLNLYPELMKVRDAYFETDCRTFLNAVNRVAPDGIVSCPCKSAFIGEYQLQKPDDPLYKEFLIDFNFGSQRISLFCDQEPTESQDEERFWETVAIEKKMIKSYKIEETTMKSVEILLTIPGHELINFGPKSLEKKVALNFDKRYCVEDWMERICPPDQQVKVATMRKCSMARNPVAVEVGGNTQMEPESIPESQFSQASQQPSQRNHPFVHPKDVLPESQQSTQNHKTRRKVSVPCQLMSTPTRMSLPIQSPAVQIQDRTLATSSDKPATHKVKVSVATIPLCRKSTEPIGPKPPKENPQKAKESDCEKTPTKKDKTPKKVRTPLIMVSTNPKANKSEEKNGPKKVLEARMTRRSSQNSQNTEEVVQHAERVMVQNKEEQTSLNENFEDKDSPIRSDVEVVPESQPCTSGFGDVGKTPLEQKKMMLNDLKALLHHTDEKFSGYPKTVPKVAESPALSTVTEESLSKLSKAATTTPGGSQMIMPSIPENSDEESENDRTEKASVVVGSAITDSKSASAKEKNTGNVENEKGKEDTSIQCEVSPDQDKGRRSKRKSAVKSSQDSDDDVQVIEEKLTRPRRGARKECMKDVEKTEVKTKKNLSKKNSEIEETWKDKTKKASTEEHHPTADELYDEFGFSDVEEDQNSSQVKSKSTENFEARISKISGSQTASQKENKFFKSRNRSNPESCSQQVSRGNALKPQAKKGRKLMKPGGNFMSCLEFKKKRDPVPTSSQQSQQMQKEDSPLFVPDSGRTSECIENEIEIYPFVPTATAKSGKRGRKPAEKKQGKSMKNSNQKVNRTEKGSKKKTQDEVVLSESSSPPSPPQKKSRPERAKTSKKESEIYSEMPSLSSLQKNNRTTERAKASVEESEIYPELSSPPSPPQKNQTTERVQKKPERETYPELSSPLSPPQSKSRTAERAKTSKKESEVHRGLSTQSSPPQQQRWQKGAKNSKLESELEHSDSCSPPPPPQKNSRTKGRAKNSEEESDFNNAFQSTIQKIQQKIKDATPKGDSEPLSQSSQQGYDLASIRDSTDEDDMGEVLIHYDSKAQASMLHYEGKEKTREGSKTRPEWDEVRGKRGKTREVQEQDQRGTKGSGLGKEGDTMTGNNKHQKAKADRSVMKDVQQLIDDKEKSNELIVNFSKKCSDLVGKMDNKDDRHATGRRRSQKLVNYKELSESESEICSTTNSFISPPKKKTIGRKFSLYKPDNQPLLTPDDQTIHSNHKLKKKHIFTDTTETQSEASWLASTARTNPKPKPARTYGHEKNKAKRGKLQPGHSVFCIDDDDDDDADADKENKGKSEGKRGRKKSTERKPKEVTQPAKTSHQFKEHSPYGLSYPSEDAETPLISLYIEDEMPASPRPADVFKPKAPRSGKSKLFKPSCPVEEADTPMTSLYIEEDVPTLPNFAEVFRSKAPRPGKSKPSRTLEEADIQMTSQYIEDELPPSPKLEVFKPKTSRSRSMAKKFKALKMAITPVTPRTARRMQDDELSIEEMRSAPEDEVDMIPRPISPVIVRIRESETSSGEEDDIPEEGDIYSSQSRFSHISSIKTPMTQPRLEKVEIEEGPELELEELSPLGFEMPKSGPSSRRKSSYSRTEISSRDDEEDDADDEDDDNAESSSEHSKESEEESTKTDEESSKAEESQGGSFYRPRKLFKTDDEADHVPNEGSSSSHSPPTSMPGNVGIQAIPAFIKSFGAEYQKKYLSRKDKLDQYSKDALDSTRKHVAKHWLHQQSTRQRFMKQFTEEILQDLDDLEKDIGNLKQAEKSSVEFLRTHLNDMRSCRNSQEHRIQNLKRKHTSFAEEQRNMEKNLVGQQQNVREVLKKELQVMQKKILLQSQKEEMTNLKRTLQMMLQ